MTKMTKKDWFNELLKVVEETNLDNKDGMILFINHEIELLSRDKKSSVTRTQKENEKIKAIIKIVLAEHNNPMTTDELMHDERLSMYSNQKLSALLRQLRLDNEIIRSEVKRRAYFSLM